MPRDKPRPSRYDSWMRTCAATVVAGLWAGSAFAQAIPSPSPPPEQTLKTLLIRGRTGETVMPLDQRAVAGLVALDAGDKLTLTVRDEATGEERILTSFVTSVVRKEPTERSTRSALDETVQIVSIDPSTRTLMVQNGRGERQVVRVDERLVAGFRDLRPGEKVGLGWRYREGGRAEPVLEIQKQPPSAPLPIPEKVPSGVSVEVVATDPIARTLIVRPEGQAERLLLVYDRLVETLKKLQVGDIVVLTGDESDDRVAEISQRRAWPEE